MIITCEICSVKFNVSVDALGKNGRIVRCSNCNHEWFETAQTDILKADDKIKVENTAAVVAPNVEEKSPAKDLTVNVNKLNDFKDSLPNKSDKLMTFMKVITILLIITLIISGVILHQDKLTKIIPEMRHFYKFIQLNQADNLKFTIIDCTLKNQNSDHTVELDVQLVIKNISERQQRLDSIRFSTYSKDRIYLGEFVMQINKSISAGRDETIEGVLNRVPKEVAFIGIELGGALDFTLRSPSQLLKVKKLD